LIQPRRAVPAWRSLIGTTGGLLLPGRPADYRGADNAMSLARWPLARQAAGNYRAHLVEPPAIGLPPHILAGADDRTAPCADLASSVRFVLLRIEIVHLPPLAGLLFNLTLRLVLAIGWHNLLRVVPRPAGRMLEAIFLAVLRRWHSHRDPSVVLIAGWFAYVHDPTTKPSLSTGSSGSRFSRRRVR
jgi:hypothetical protein